MPIEGGFRREETAPVRIIGAVVFPLAMLTDAVWAVVVVDQAIWVVELMAKFITPTASVAMPTGVRGRAGAAAMSLAAGIMRYDAKARYRK